VEKLEVKEFELIEKFTRRAVENFLVGSTGAEV
jgi:hypothetical protein